MSDDRDRIRDRVSIVDVVGRHVQLKRAGKGFIGLCPFHQDRKPSLHVNPELGIYKCFACGAGGDIFKFVQETERVGFREALEMLAKEAGVELSSGPRDADAARRARQFEAMQFAQRFFQTQWKQSTLAQNYCKNRGITEEVVTTWGLGFGPDDGSALATLLKKEGFNLAECKELFLVDQDDSGGYFDRFRGRLTFPIFDERGRLVAFGGRIIGNGIPKYINSSDTPLYSKRRILYGMNVARSGMSDSGLGVLVEGYLDVIACHRAGVTQAVASLGTSLSEEHAALLKRWCERVTVLYDADEAGKKAADRAEQILTAQGLKVRIALMPEGQDPDTLLREVGAEAVQRAAKGGLTPTDFRFAELKRKLTPADEAFWDQAFEILVSAPHALEVERHVTELAGLYPGTRDPVAAAEAIRREVQRRRPAPQRPQRAPASSGSAIPKVALHASEQTLFLALMNESLTEAAWDALNEDLVFTGEGIALWQTLRAALGDTAPSGPVGQWTQGLDSSMQEALMLLKLKEIVPVSRAVLVDAIEKLRSMKARRELTTFRKQSDSTSDSVMAEAQERLRQIHALRNRKNP